MKPKSRLTERRISFSTPQPKLRDKFDPHSRRSVSSISIDAEERNPNETLFEKLMCDPLKRALVLKLLSQEKESIENYKRNEKTNKPGSEAERSPLNNLKRKFRCESPSALLRRRAIEKQNQDSDSGSSSVSDRNFDRQAVVRSPVPFNKLLEGVVAFVEVRSKDIDRSESTKAFMRTMGAVVRDQFIKDVTHVVFKDGSFNTYQKAKLMKVHLVSVLWLDAIKRNNARVPEKYHPALGTDAYDTNVSTICQELQNDYEEVVRDEYRRSLDLQSSASRFITQRRKTAFPSPLYSSPSSSSISFHTTIDKNVDHVPSSQDQEVSSIISGGSLMLSRRKNHALFTAPSSNSSKLGTPELSSDDSDCGVINGVKVIKDTLDIDEVVTNPESSEKLQTCNNIDNQVTPSRPCSPQSRKRSVTRSESTKSVLTKNEILKLRNSISTNESTNVSNGSTSLMSYNNCNTFIRPRSKPRKKRFSGNKSEDMEIASNITNIQEKENLKQKTRKSIRNKSSPSPLLSGNSLNKSNDVVKEKRKNKSLESDNNVDISNSCIDGIIQQTQSSQKKTSTGSLDLSPLYVSVERLHFSKTEEANKVSIDSESMTPLILTANIKTSQEKVKNKSSISSEDISSLRISTDNSKSKSTGLEKGVIKKKSILMENRRNLRSSTIASNPDVSDKILVASPPNKAKQNTEENSMTPVGDKVDMNYEVTSDNSSRLSLKKASFMSDSSTSSSNLRDAVIQNIVHLLSEEESDSINDTEQNSKKIHSSSPAKKCRVYKKSIGDKSQSNSQRTNAKTTMRKLYNLNQSIDESLIPWDLNENPKKNTASTENNATIFKKPTLMPLTPVLLTAKAKKFLGSCSSEEGTDKEVTKTKKQEKIATDNKLQRKKKKNIVDSATADVITNEKTRKIQKEPVPSTPLRRSVRVSTSREMHTQQESNLKGKLPITPVNRRSTMEFQPKTVKKGLSQKKVAVKKSIVCTRLHRPDVQVFTQIVKKLGRFFVEDEVTDNTTHLVVGESKRTINILRAIAKGCWVLKHEWIFRSLDAETWLPEEDYELTEFSPAVQKCRLERQAFGNLYSMDIFENCGPIYIARSSIPRCSDLQELITLCKGTVTRNNRSAKIIVGEYVRYGDVVCVSEKWLLDSITFNRKKSFKNYLIKSAASPNF